MTIFRAHGMTDTESGKLQMSTELVTDCVELLKGDESAIHLYLLALSHLDCRAYGSVFRAAVRMAAQYREFSRGRCPEVLPTYSQPHWAGAFLLGTQFFLDKEKNKLKARIKFLVYTGPQAGAYVFGTFPKQFIYVLAREVGAFLSGRHSRLDNAQHPDAINFVRVLGFVETRKALVVSRVAATSGMKTYNKKLVRSRFRDLHVCPFGALFDCVQCAAFTDQCERGVRIRNE